MSELTNSEKLQYIIDNDIHEFIKEMCEDEELSVFVKGAVMVDVQYSIERLAIAVNKLQEAEAT